MAERITKARLERAISSLNYQLGTPQEPYKRLADGTLKSQEGCYYLSGAYSGVRLERMSSGGGSSDVFNTGYTTKRDLYNQVTAMLYGIMVARQAK